MGDSTYLSDGEKRTLLDIARYAIRAELDGNPSPPLDSLSDALSRRAGVFVTLRTGNNLRGCIGYIEPLFPLAGAVQKVAVKAATEDPRFMPLSVMELDAITIEISVLTPLEKITNIDSIEIGKHGLVIDAGYRRGLLLPQVAVEYGWDRIQFLNHTAVKAGLPPEAWKRKEYQLFTFTVDKFDESELARAQNH